MADFSDIEVFEGKSLSDLFKEIYDNSAAKRNQIKDLIASLAPLVEGIGDATLLVPLIKEYLDIGVKNDEQLVKLAQIIQRYDSGNKKGSGADDLWADLSGLIQDDKQNQAQLEEVKAENANINNPGAQDYRS